MHCYLKSQISDLFPFGVWQYYLFWKNEIRTEAMYALNADKGTKFSFKPGETSKTLRFGFATPDKPVTALEVPAWY